MPSMAHDCQDDRVTEKRMEEESIGETDPLLTEESPQIHYQSVDRIDSKTTQREVTTTAEIHPYTTANEVCTTTGCTTLQAEKTENP